VLRALLSEKVPVVMACGGKGLCATCHVYIDAGEESLTPRTKKEVRTLGLLHDAQPCSRLACQAQVLRDGVQVRLPAGLRIEKSEDLEALVGRRTEVPVLHPVDGRILVVPGKLITRSVVVTLKAAVDVDLAKMIRDSKGV
jgi:ferredoxin